MPTLESTRECVVTVSCAKKISIDKPFVISAIIAAGGAIIVQEKETQRTELVYQHVIRFP